MGTFQVEFEIGDPQGGRWQTQRGMVGTKAANAWLPQPLLEELGVQIEKRVSLRHTDGRLIKRDVGQTWLRIGDKSVMTAVVFGEKRDPVLVGHETLEALGLKADLAKEKLMPVSEGATAG
jgi:predicted aspartyl protease